MVFVLTLIVVHLEAAAILAAVGHWIAAVSVLGVLALSCLTLAGQSDDRGDPADRP